MDPDHLFQASAAPASGRRIAASLAAFAAAFALAACALQHGLTAVGHGARNETLEQKWRQFESQADDCDLLFLGTSRVYRHLDPAAFDQAMYDEGMRVRSFNFGLPKMSILEAREVAKRLAVRRPKRLKLVVIEPMLFLFDLDNWTSQRDMAMHDWRGTRLAVRNTLGAERRRGSPWIDRLHYAMPHALSFACREVSLGLAAPLLFPACSPHPAVAADGSDDANAGFAPLPVVSDMQAAWRDRFGRFLALPQPPDWRGAPLSEEELGYFKELIGFLGQAGARPAFLVGPRVKRDSHTVAVLESRRTHFADVPLLDYLRGRGETELYRIEYWHDFDHLNAAGARLLSQRVARDLAPWLRKGGERDGRAARGVRQRTKGEELRNANVATSQPSAPSGSRPF